MEYQQYKRGYTEDYLSYFKGITNKEGWPFLTSQSERIPAEFEMQFGVNVTTKYKIQETLELVEIYFASPTFDKITKDAKTNVVTKISMIGGTLGLFAGFSIFSSVEIFYFLCKFFFGLYRGIRTE